VDAIIAGHTHQAVAHRVHGIPMVQAYANGRAFGRLDLHYDLDASKLLDIRIFPPRDICLAAPPAPCEAAPYEDRPVQADAAIAAMLAPDEANARTQMLRPLGVTLTAPLRRAYAEESPLGNLVADLMRRGQPGADVAITNGGGLRADLPQGPLTYGALYEALPFENRMATLTLTGAQLRHVLQGNLQGHGGIVSTSGIRATATCVHSTLDVHLTRADGRPIADDEQLVLATTDFLATGGDGLLSSLGPHTLHDTIMRDVVAGQLSAAGGTLAPSDTGLFDPASPRLVFPGPRPVRCP
jgi:5'-nucleotidase